MKAGKTLPVTLSLVAGLASVFTAVSPAQAGDTARVHGCAAHWRTTAAWNECLGAPAVRVRLEVECDWETDYSGPWRNVSGDVNPVDRFECFYKAAKAYQSFQ